jgi:hypothetical protein
MSDYTWELGIDWNAITTDGSSYLRQGFVYQGEVVSPLVKTGDTITFVIFDVSSGVASAEVAGIESFVILSRAAVDNQSSGDPLSSLQPAFDLDLNTAQSTVFGGSALRSWTTPPVVVVEIPGTNRFLLTFQAQARGLASGSSRLFGHDPEMVVGPNGSPNGRGGSQPDQESVIAHVAT